MIVDTSALIAIIRNEPEAELFTNTLLGLRTTMSAATYLEAGIVVDSERDPALSQQLDAIIQKCEVTVAPFTSAQSRLARQAYRDFGKGSGHPAKLNFGDCFAYALAIERGEPLLFKGNDFTHTGIARA